MTKYEDYRYETDFRIPETMQAMVAHGIGFENLAIEQVPVPKINDNQLLARVDAAGVCTSIIKIIEQGDKHPYLNGWDLARWPLTFGDEGAITIVKVSGNLKDKYNPGQRFTIQPSLNTAPVVHRDRYNNNAEGIHKCAVGYTIGGHLGQYICVQEEVFKADCLLQLPDDEMAYFEVSMAEPISCVYSAQDRNYHIIKQGPHAHRKAQLGLLRGGVAVVIGAGAMGRMHVELALRFEPAVLIVSDLIQERLARVVKSIGEKAKRKGTKLICVQAAELDRTVREVSNGRGADDIILAVGVRSVQQKALDLLADGGVANLFGGLARGDHILEVDGRSIHYREIKLVGSSGGEPSDMSATLQAINKGEIDPGNYVAGVGSLDNAIDVLKMIKETKIDAKAILYPHIKHTPLQMVDYWDKDREIKFINERMQGQ
ncbi:MAG: zinc-binding dehydrogenase [Sedimentisphaerales bacterium]|nr:zinc-binding dehydrogenase [Sedimentisphaerales bacterium]